MTQQLAVNSDILAEAARVSGIDNYNKIVDESIRVFIALNSQKKLAKLKGKIAWSGDLNKAREMRDGNG